MHVDRLSHWTHEQTYVTDVTGAGLHARLHGAQKYATAGESSASRGTVGWVAEEEGEDTLPRNNCYENMYAPCRLTVPRRLWMTPPV